MKIAFYTVSFKKGGAERVIANLSNSLVRNNNIALFLEQSNEIGYNLDSNIKLYDLNPIKKHCVKKNFSILSNLKKSIDDFKPDVIICFLEGPSIRTAFLKFLRRLRNIKVIISVRNDPVKTYNSFFKRGIIKFLYKYADGFVFQTTDQKNYFSKKIQDKSTIIYNPVNELFLKNDEFDNIKKENSIINIGRLTNQKNQKNLICAFENIHKKYPDYILNIYGEGELENDLKNLINDKNLNKCVFLKGKIDNVKEVLLKSKVFVLSSDYEGMPNALIEAMVSGLACISTNCPCGGPKELIINNETGILIDVDNVKEIEYALDRVLSNDEFLKKISTNAKNLAKKVDPEIIKQQWIDYILLVERK